MQNFGNILVYILKAAVLKYGFGSNIKKPQLVQI